MVSVRGRLKHEIAGEESHASTGGTHDDPSVILANIRQLLLLPPISVTDLLFLISSASYYLPGPRERELQDKDAN